MGRFGYIACKILLVIATLLVGALLLYLGAVEAKTIASAWASEVMSEIDESITRVRIVPMEPPIADVDEAIEDAAKEFNVPVSLMYAIAKNENYKDKLNDARSPKGALGIMQIMPKYHVGQGRTCPWLRTWADLVGPKNIRNNVRCGAKYLRVLMDRYEKVREPAKFARAVIFDYNRDYTYVDNVVYTYLGEEMRRRT